MRCEHCGILTGTTSTLCEEALQDIASTRNDPMLRDY